MPSHILIDNVLRDTADLALCRAAQLATQYQAKLTLLHVAEGQQSSSAVASLRVAAEQVLGERLATYCHGNAEVRLEAGKPSEVIHQILGEGDVDLLVLGAHHKGRPELFTGTNLDRLAHAGIRLADFHSAPACSPTRAMLLASLTNALTVTWSPPVLMLGCEASSSIEVVVARIVRGTLADDDPDRTVTVAVGVVKVDPGE